MNKDYQHYLADDFITDDFFQQWVQQPGEENSRFWEQWIHDHPHKLSEVNQAMNFLISLRFQTSFPNAKEIEYSLQKQLQLIDAVVDAANKRPEKNLLRHVFAWSAAVICSGAIIFGIWHYGENKAISIEIVTGDGEIKKVLLPDGSQVTLNGNSVIQYPSSMYRDFTRQIWLKGEAFFEVNINGREIDHRRFIVHSDKLEIEGGTNFNIQNRESITNVTLHSGKISLHLKNDQGSLMTMEPGDFIQYSDEQKHILKKQVKPELYSAWKEVVFHVDNMPLAYITQYFRDVYGYNTRIEDKHVAAAKLSGNLVLKNEQVLVQTLTVMMDIEINKKGNVLVLKKNN